MHVGIARAKPMGGFTSGPLQKVFTWTGNLGDLCALCFVDCSTRKKKSAYQTPASVSVARAISVGGKIVETRFLQCPSLRLWQKFAYSVVDPLTVVARLILLHNPRDWDGLWSSEQHLHPPGNLTENGAEALRRDAAKSCRCTFFGSVSVSPRSRAAPATRPFALLYWSIRHPDGYVGLATDL